MVDLLKHLGARMAAHRLFSQGGWDPDGWRALKDEAIDLDHVTNVAGPIVRTLVRFTYGGGFEFDSMGMVAFTMAVHDENAETVIDLVAWSAHDPATFGSMFGAGILGVDRLHNPATYTTGPCRLYPTPLDWLRAGCEDGCCILDFSAARDDLAQVQGLLMPGTFEFGDSLIRAGVVRADRLVVPDRRAA